MRAAARYCAVFASQPTPSRLENAVDARACVRPGYALPAVHLREREQRSAADTSPSVDLSKLLASARKNIQRTSIDVAELKQRKATLDDQQRAAFRALRDQLNELIGD